MGERDFGHIGFLSVEAVNRAEKKTQQWRDHPRRVRTFVEEGSEHVTPRVSDLNERARPPYAWTPQVGAWHPDWACAGVGRSRAVGSKEEMGQN